MNLDDLSADQLAAIDEVCLAFENQHRAGNPLSIDEVVQRFKKLHGGNVNDSHLRLLRSELQEVESELNEKSNLPKLDPDSIPTPFQSKTKGKPDTIPRFSPNVAAPTDDQLTQPYDSDAAQLSSPRRSSAKIERDSNLVTHEDKPGEPGSHRNLSSESRPSNTLSSQDMDRVRPARSGKASTNEQTPRKKSYSIGPYQLGPVLARGGMGVVYRASDTRLDRPVAIKMLGFPHLATTDPKRIELVERFEREARAVAALSHPNIVELFDVGVVDGVPYAVMELLRGSTLSKQLRAGRLSADHTRLVGMQIAGALATAHSAGVIHRDLKPQNIMLIQQGDSGDDDAVRVKLVDFGLSRVSESGLGGSGDSSSNTRLGTILGTPGYMAPEQARGEAATSAADIFGLGSVLFEIYNGRPAFPGDTPADRLAITLTGQVIPEPPRCEESKRLCDLIMSCLEKTPDKRPTASDLYQQLRSLPDERMSRIVVGEREELIVKNVMLRRVAIGGLAAGIAGAAFGVWKFMPPAVALDEIESLAVLTFRDLGEPAAVDGSGLPLAGRELTEGEAIAAAVAYELSEVDGLEIRPFRPLIAESKEQFQKLNEQLDVDVFLAGSFFNVESNGESTWVMRWKLVDAKTGQQLHEEEFVSEERLNSLGDRMLVQRRVAQTVAARIDRVLLPESGKVVAPVPKVYGCLVKGRAQADTDSTEGLQEALKCFSDAHQADQAWIEPLAAIAVTSLNLAARTGREEAEMHIRTAREKLEQALKIDPQSVDARLAQAMFEWQQLNNYRAAKTVFDRLHQDFRYNSQVLHQRGLFLATLGKREEALTSLLSASRMNPMSVLLKSDRARVNWFFGNTQSASDATNLIAETLPPTELSRNLAVGLLIDIYEHSGRFANAAQLLGTKMAIKDNDPQTYFQARKERLKEIPYGPYGDELNETILKLRMAPAENSGRLVEQLGESFTPMFPLLLSRHPAFSPLRSTSAAQSYLPPAELSFDANTGDGFG